jgi:hypothetical protein
MDPDLAGAALDDWENDCKNSESGLTRDKKMQSKIQAPASWPVAI